MGKNKNYKYDDSLDVAMGSPPSLKAKIICLAMVAVLALISFIAGKIEMSVYNDKTASSTSQVTGVVVNKGQGMIYHADPVETKYLINGSRKQHWIHIQAETDGVFKTKDIYAKLGGEQKGETVIICYDPNDPTGYYIGSRIENYKTTGVVLYVLSGLLVLGLLLLAWAMFRKKPVPPADDRKYYESPFGKFIFVDKGDHGYECDVKWPGNDELTVYFDTDGLETDQPGECLARLSRYLSDKKRTDSDVKRRIAGYFMGKSALISEDASEEALIEKMELFHIGSYRNGEVRSSIDTVSGIYADDIMLVCKSGGGREIRWSARNDTGEYQSYAEELK
ncbi:MAG: hypothetical protein IJ071_02515 [Ruminococcus sp.]|nr:hypothetical protein [Ruminococcus sp.]